MVLLLYRVLASAGRAGISLRLPPNKPPPYSLRASRSPVFPHNPIFSLFGFFYSLTCWLTHGSAMKVILCAETASRASASA